MDKRYFVIAIAIGSAIGATLLPVLIRGEQ